MLKNILIIAAVIYGFVTFVAPLPSDLKAKPAYDFNQNQTIPVTAQAHANIIQVIGGSRIKSADPNQYEGKAISHSMAGLPESGKLDCVALLNVDFYNRTGIKPKVKGVSALDIWNNPDKFFPDGFKNYEIIKNSPDFIPEVGDYVFWNAYPESNNPEFKTKSWNGKILSGKSDYGHVAIAMTSTKDILTVKNQDTFSNNGKGDKPTWQADYIYNGVVGVFRLKN